MKLGIKRVFIAIGYSFFVFVGIICGSSAGEYSNGLIKMLCIFLGFWGGIKFFEILRNGIAWIVEGFKKKN